MVHDFNIKLVQTVHAKIEALAENVTKAKPLTHHHQQEQLTPGAGQLGAPVALIYTGWFHRSFSSRACLMGRFHMPQRRGLSWGLGCSSTLGTASSARLATAPTARLLMDPTVLGHIQPVSPAVGDVNGVVGVNVGGLHPSPAYPAKR
ncbi:hypothetical protein VaNZ11_008884, partial [Volvox africanus]